MYDEIPLDQAFDLVKAAWQPAVERQEMSMQTYDKWGLLLQRFINYASGAGVRLVNQVDDLLVENFTYAYGHSRGGVIAMPSPSTQSNRRAAIRTAWRTMRDLGLTSNDPGRDVLLPPRQRGGTRPLDEGEAVSLRHHAQYARKPTRHAAAVALALAGAGTGEIGHITTGDLDRANDRVWAHGSSKTDARWLRLDSWASTVLCERADHVVSRTRRSARSLPLAVSDRHAGDAALQARACVALADILTRAGLAGEPGIRPASVTAYAGLRVFERLDRVEEVALCLGLRSLDRAAAVIGHEWHSTHSRTDGGNLGNA